MFPFELLWVVSANTDCVVEILTRSLLFIWCNEVKGAIAVKPRFWVRVRLDSRAFRLPGRGL